MSARAATQPATAQSPFGARAAVWRLDPDQSEARFRAATLWGRVPVAGQLGRLTGTLDWDRTRGRGQLAVATGGLSTGIKLRDHHLRAAAFFDVRNHPEITFEIAEVVVADDHQALLDGGLSVRGRGHPFACVAAIEVLAEDRIVVETEAAFDLDELGISRGLMRMIPAQVTAAVRVVLQRELG